VFLVSGRTGTILSARRRRTRDEAGRAFEHDGVPVRSRFTTRTAIRSTTCSSARSPAIAHFLRSHALLDAVARSLFRARPAGDVDDDRSRGLRRVRAPRLDPGRPWSSRNGRPRAHCVFAGEGIPLSSARWRAVGDQDGDGREDLAVVSDNELESGWGVTAGAPASARCTVYSGPGRVGDPPHRPGDAQGVREEGDRGVERASRLASRGRHRIPPEPSHGSRGS
jgi:hypothetical protein